MENSRSVEPEGTDDRTWEVAEAERVRFTDRHIDRTPGVLRLTIDVVAPILQEPKEKEVPRQQEQSAEEVRRYLPA